MFASHPALAWVGLVTVAALIVYGWTGIVVGRMRGRHGIKAPAMSGHPEFERAVRVQMNTLEQLVPFLASLWLCALAWSALAAAVIGAAFVVGRLLYAISYQAAPEKRGPGFLIGYIASALLMLGAIYGLVRGLV